MLHNALETIVSKKSFSFEGYRPTVFQVVWVVLIVIATGVRIFSLPYDYAELSSVCAGEECSNPSLSLKNLPICKRWAFQPISMLPIF